MVVFHSIPSSIGSLILYMQVDEKGEDWEIEFTKVFANGYSGFENIWTFSRAG